MKKKTWGLAISGLLLAATGIFAQNCGIVTRPAVEDMSFASINSYQHTGLETSCASCHNSERPAPSLKLPLNATAALNQSLSQYVHQASYGGQGDCYSCHATEKAGIGLTWSGAQYNHLDNAGQTVTSCTSCHQAPKATLTSNPRIGFDHAGNTQDCISCHTNVGQTWTTSYTHTGNETSCSTCHLDRPAPNVRLPATATAALNQSLTQYVHQVPYNGLGDCVACHTENKANVGVTWAGGFYDHTTPTGAKVSTCVTCHLAPKGNPTTIPAVAFDHSSSTADCITCHTNPGIAWSGASGAHSHMPTDSCLNCHLAERPAATTLKPTKVAGVPWKNLFVHSADYVNGIDCNSCHTKNLANLGVSWSDAGFNHRTVAGTEVKSCAPCHTSGEDRPAQTLKLPTNATAALNQSLTQFVHQAAFNGFSDCVACHADNKANIGVTWAGGVYKHTTSTGTAVATCVACHVAPKGNPTTNPAVAFDHTKTTADCITCHKSPGVSWAGATGAHAHMPTDSCLSCHVSDRPAATVIKPAKVTGVPWKNLFVHSADYVNGIDCRTCHTKNLANLGVSWSDAAFGHKTVTGAAVQSCAPCHTTGEDRPAANVRLPSTTTTVSNVYYHDNAYGGLSDCMKCHLPSSPNLGKTWAGGVFNHQNASGQPITSGCINCHSAQMPGPTVAMPTNLVNSFVHAANYVGTGDCFGCHTTKNTNTKASSAWAGARWKNRTTHHKTTSGATVTTCLPCHSNRDHNKGRECYQCHRNAGQNWNEL